MNAVWPGPAQPAAPTAPHGEHGHGSPAVMHHVLDGLAGFHGTEVEALTTVQKLAGPLGVQARQMVLLGPHDSPWPRFVYRARRWNRRPHGQGGASMHSLGLVALFTALVGLLLTAGLLERNEFVSFGIELLAMAAAAVLGGTIAACLVALLHRQQPQFKDFDRTIRHRLAQGEWVVLVHDLPWARQAAVVELIARRSTSWVAVTSSRDSR